MKLNTKIPGWNSQQILEVLARHANNVPENGHILELGALFGRSTYALGFNKKDSVKLTSIDIWPTIMFKNHIDVSWHDGECGAEELQLMTSKYKSDRLEGSDFFDLWKEYTKGIVNNTGIQAYTNMSNSDFPVVDFIFHDAGHSYENVYEDLIHWFPKLKTDGSIIIDDYDPQFSGVIKAVDQFVEENNLYKEMVTGRNILLKRQI